MANREPDIVTTEEFLGAEPDIVTTEEFLGEEEFFTPTRAAGPPVTYDKEIGDLAYEEYRDTIIRNLKGTGATVQIFDRSSFERAGQIPHWVDVIREKGKGRGLRSNIAEAWKRTSENMDLDAAYADAVFMGIGDADQIYNQYRRLKARQIIDPIEGNTLEEMLYGSVGVAASMGKSIKAAAPYMAAGAGIAAAAGQAGPQVALPEEVVTIPAGIALGWKAGSTQYFARQGAGQMLLTLKDQGFESRTTKAIALAASIPYALIEMMQISHLTPGLRAKANVVVQKSIMGVVTEAMKRYGKTFGTEVIEEVLQESVQMAAEDLSKFFEGEGIDVDAAAMKERGTRLLMTAIEAGKAMALMPIPGGVVDVISGVAGVKAQKKAIIDLSREIASRTSLNREQIDAAILKSFKETESELSEIREGVPGVRKKAVAAVKDEQIIEIFREKLRDNVATMVQANVIDLAATVPTMIETEAGEMGYLPDLDIVDYEATVDKLANLAAEAAPVREVQEKGYSVERGKRAAEAENILRSGKSEEVFRNAKNALAGDLPVEAFEPVVQEFTVKEIEDLRESINLSEKLRTFEKIKLQDAVEKLLFPEHLKLPTRSELALIEKQWGAAGLRLAKALSAKMQKSKWNNAMEAINLPRTLLASCDLSAPLRQGAIFAVSHPKQWAASTWAGYKILFSPKMSEEHAEFYQNQVETNPYYLPAVKAGVEFPRWQGVARTFTEREEEFASSWAERIPGVGRFVKRSNRAYTVGLNKLRMDVFAYIADGMDNATEADLRNIANMINVFSGRGRIGKGKIAQERIAPILNAVAFSPRFQMSRIQTFQLLTQTLSDPKMSWAVRKIIWADLAKFAGVGLSIMGLAALAGYDVEPDPRSADFGKVRLGNTRYDVWAGYSPLIRTSIQLALGEKKSTTTGRVYEVKGIADRYEYIIQPFLRSKLNPVSGFTWDVATGETFIGEEVSLTDPKKIAERAFEAFTPFAVQDTIDAYRFAGFNRAILTLPLAFHGVGVATYRPTAFKTAIETKNRLSVESYGKRWDEIGPIAQQILKLSRPQIGLADSKARAERTKYAFVAKEIEKSEAVGREIQEDLPKDVQRELNDNFVRIGGLSRRVSNNWWLNDKRYGEYQKLTKTYLNRILPAFTKQPLWDKMPMKAKQEWLTRIIGFSKEIARKQIIAKAGKDDVLSIRQMKGR